MIPFKIAVIFAISILPVAFSDSRPWPQTYLGHVDNLMADDRDGSLYVASGKNVRKYTKDLLELSRTEGSSNNSSQEEVPRAINKFLSLLTVGDKETLFSCHQEDYIYLVCNLIDAERLDSTKQVFFSIKGIEANRILSPASIRVHHSKVDDRDAYTIETSNLNYITDASLNNQYAQLAGFGVYEMRQETDRIVFDQKMELKQLSQNFSLNYETVFSFVHKNYTYLILNYLKFNHRTDVDETSGLRIARVNNKKPESYIELRFDYSRVYSTWATLDNENTSNPVLHIVTKGLYLTEIFNENFYNTYNLMEIDEIFSAIENSCAKVVNSQEEKLNSSEFSNISIKKHNCSTKSYPTILEIQQLTLQNSSSYKIGIELDEIDFLYNIQQGDYMRYVTFAGSKNGLIKKMNPTRKGYSIDLNPPKSAKAKNESLELPQASFNYYLFNRTVLYALDSDGTLNSLDLNACFYYTTPRTCSFSQDVLDCSWCSDKCTKLNDCSVKKLNLGENATLIIESNQLPNSTVKLSLDGQECSQIVSSTRNNFRCSLNLTKSDPPNRTESLKLPVDLIYSEPSLQEFFKVNIYHEKGNESVLTSQAECLISDNNAQKLMCATEKLDEIDIQEFATNLNMGTYEILFTLILIVIVVIFLSFIVKYINSLYFHAKREKKKSAIPEATLNSSNSTSYFSNAALENLLKADKTLLDGNYFGRISFEESSNSLPREFPNAELLELLKVNNILIEWPRIRLGHELGSGQFGKVYKGFLNLEDGLIQDVAVKILRAQGSYVDDKDRQDFLVEGLIMKDFKHVNVLPLIGVSFDSSGAPLIITPFMLHGNLRSYIRGESFKPSVVELMKLGAQVANGMAYLAELHFVHRDLAARNCMVDEKLIVKIADFGLSRDIYESDYYMSENKSQPRPIRWMAIESIKDYVYNEQTDIWSFGILLWELMTFGGVPYPDVNNFHILKYLQDGRRMMKPEHCPDQIYDIMMSCWNEIPNDRPTFSKLVESTHKVLINLNNQ